MKALATSKIHETAQRVRARPREREGYVVSDKMSKTVIVEVLRIISHPVYKKIVKKKIRYKAHCEDNKAKVGDRVRIVETRPLSKEKRWAVAEVLK